MSKTSGYKKFMGLVAAIGLGVLTAGQAKAGYTTINAPNFGKGGEASQAEILSHTYGGTFVADGLNFTNGSKTAVRIDDDNDQMWSLHILSTKALATFASLKQGLAIEAGKSVEQLFNVSGKGYNVTGGTGEIDTPKSYEFVRNGGSSTAFESVNSENNDGKDHMVTYLLVNNEVRKQSIVQGEGKHVVTYVTFWEDLSKAKHSDFDFNDLAVEIKGNSATVVPLPAAAWSGLATLAGGALAAGYRKRRQLA